MSRAVERALTSGGCASALDPKPGFARLRSDSKGKGVLASVAIALLATACAAHRAVPPPVTSPVVEPTLEGRTSVRLLNADATASRAADPFAERITPAHASSDNRLPDYPAYALKAGCRDGAVPVRVFVGPDGNVAAQRDVPDRPLPTDPCHMAFRAAVQATVAGWKFAPAFRQRAEPGPDVDGDGRPDFSRWQQTPVTIYLDLEFSFAVVEGKGVVRAR